MNEQADAVPDDQTYLSWDQILRRYRGQGKKKKSCLADNGQDWQPYPITPYSAISDDSISRYMPVPVSFARAVIFILCLCKKRQRVLPFR